MSLFAYRMSLVSIRTIRSVTLMGALALVACKSEITAPRGATAPPPRTAVRGVLVTTMPQGAQLSVQLNASRMVQVDYWTDSTDRLRVTAPADTAPSNITLYRLRANRSYQFEIRAIENDGSLGPATVGYITTPPLPDDLAAMRFVPTGSVTYGVTMFEVSAIFTGFVAVDAGGEVVWYYRTQGAPHGFTVRKNGNFVLNDFPNGLRELTPCGQLVRTMSAAQLGGAAHHDVIATPENTLLFLQQETRDFDGAPLTGDRIVEWNPETGDVTPRWSVFDHYSPDSSWGSHSGWSDWTHANSLAIGPHGNVVLSLNWLDQVVSIAPGWEAIEWRLGGVGSSFAVDDDAAFMGQHSVSQVSETRVLMFDNARDRANGDTRSRGLELTLDTVAHQAHLAWQFHATPEITAPYVGSARRLPNGNTVLQFGLSAGLFGLASGPIALYEVTPAGRAVASIVVPDAWLSYRGEPLQRIGSEKVVP